MMKFAMQRNSSSRGTEILDNQTLTFSPTLALCEVLHFELPKKLTAVSKKPLRKVGYCQGGYFVTSGVDFVFRIWQEVGTCEGARMEPDSD